MGEEEREVHHPGLVHDQDAPEARDQGGQKGDLRQDGDGQGEASQDHREGLRGGGPEEIGLSLATDACLSGRESRVSVCHPWGARGWPLRCCQFMCTAGWVHSTRLYKGVGLPWHG